MCSYKKIVALLCLMLLSLPGFTQQNHEQDSIIMLLKKTADVEDSRQILDRYINSISNADTQILNVSLLGMIPFFIAFGFILFLFYMKRRESNFKTAEAEIQAQMAQIEMKALRAQMNPHFIFNCLNSIYHFMNKKDTEQASKYLIKFSNLIRSILENSLHQEVTLKDDLEALELYIQLEQMRLDQKFNYKIQIDENIDTSSFYVPPLIMQPFVENSIWHGLGGKESGGLISIQIELKDQQLSYVLEDNGSNINNPGNITEIQKLKKSSIGIAVTKERLHLLHHKIKAQANFVMTDLLDQNNAYCGKRIELKLPILRD